MKEIERLIERAKQVRTNAHAPYSGFCVGVAIKAIINGKEETHLGVNVENCSYGLTSANIEGTLSTT